MNTKLAAYIVALFLTSLACRAEAFDLLPLGSVKQIETGLYHSCALLDSGVVKCWGTNGQGELGDGTSTPFRAIASAVVGLSNVTQIAVGANHACALMNDGYLKCWGAADSGQLGSVTGGARFFNTPQQSVQHVRYIAVSAGSNTTCALDELGSVWCWGQNDAGQIGDGTNVNRSFPKAVVTGTTLSAIAVGYAQVCSIANYTLGCWGSGYFGGGRFETNDRPGTGIVGMPNNVIAVSMGTNFLCALQGDTSLWCLGANDFGQIGDNTVTTRKAPVQVGESMPMLGVESVSAGSSHICAVLEGEYVRCWGANSHGQLGIGSRTEMHIPTIVSLASVRSVSASQGEHTCAVTHSGRAYCWGDNRSGQVGIGAYGFDVLIPAPVLDDDRVFADGFEVPTAGGL